MVCIPDPEADGKAEGDGRRLYRSVLDYETEEALRKALLGVSLNDPASEATGTNDMSSIADKHANCNLDWVLPTYDPETSEAQSMKTELKRLQILSSYKILEAEREAVFETVTSITARFFQCPIALVSLVDLGRQWFVSNRGLGEVRETPRYGSFCSYAILNKSNIFIIPDATQDYRFKDHPLVVGAPYIRFYASASLVSPEGYKLGTLCVIDFKTRPQGLTLDEEETLNDLAELAVQGMVNRKKDLERRESPEELIAYTAHDLMTPLTGIQLSLSLLKDDDDVGHKLDGHHLELLNTAMASSDLLIRICRSAIDTLRTSHQGSLTVSDDVFDPITSINAPVTKMNDLVKSLHLLMEPIPKQVPLIIRLDPAVPPMILCDDLKLFRSALNFLSNAAARTKHGGIQLRIYQAKRNGELVFECEDTGTDIPVEEYQHLFQPSTAQDGSLRMCLSSVASLIGSLDGQYGFRPRVDASHSNEPSCSPHLSGSIFWFSVPLLAPESLGMSRNVLGESQIVISRASVSKSSISKSLGGEESHNFHAKMSIAVGEALRPLSRPILSDNGVATPGKGCDAKVSQDKPPLSYFRDAPESSSSSRDKMGADRAVIPRQITGRVPQALVIDDSLVIRKSLCMALKRLGYETFTAVDGMEGFQQLKETEFDLVLCDFLMPVMDGFDCVKQYREWEAQCRPTSKQLIFGVSAHVDAEGARRGISAGMDDFRPKPISFTTLAAIKVCDLAKARTKELDTRFSLIESMASDESKSNDENGTEESSSSTDADADTDTKLPAVSARKRDSETDDSNRGASDEHKSFSKRSRHCRSTSGAGMVCLMATDRPSTKASEVLTRLEAHGWKVVVVHDGPDTLRLLKVRNWDLVMIDDDLTELDGTVTSFRQWEAKNRINKQRGIFLVSNIDIPSPTDRSAIVQPPDGFDNVIRKPVVWKDLNLLMSSSRDTLSIVQ